MNMNATLIGQSIAFRLLCVVLHEIRVATFEWQRLKSAKRKLKTVWQLQIKLRKTFELAREEATAKLKEAKAQASQISSSQAKKRAAQLVDEETKRGHEEREKIMAQGH